MITAKFFGTADMLMGAEISGHAGYADHGFDVACASVTSAVQLTANGISEILKSPVDVAATDNKISIVLRQKDLAAMQFLSALYLHLGLLAEEFEGTIKVIITEV